MESITIVKTFIHVTYLVSILFASVSLGEYLKSRKELTLAKREKDFSQRAKDSKVDYER